MCALAALVALRSLIPGENFEFTPIGTAVCAFALWVVLMNQWANPSYTAAAPYHAAFLFGGFLLGRRAGPKHAGLMFAAGIALWGVWQRVGLGEPRAYGPFETPNTLSTVINLVLVPGLVVFA